MILQAGSVNLTALIVPDLYVQVVPPSVALLNGVPTNILGLVGTASWGPVNSPVIVGDMAGYAANFGAIKNRANDLGTAAAIAVQQGNSNLRCVRVTDGTEETASASLQVVSGNGTVNACGFASLYPGSGANSDTVTIGAGSNTNQTYPTFKVTVARPGMTAEVFDNLGGTGNAFWTALAAAINNGQGPLRGRSQLVRATAASATTLPTVGQTVTLTGGADGATTITGSVLVGSDTSSPRSGMYALRGTGASVGVLVDNTDYTTAPTQVAFGLSEGIYMVGTGPAGETIADAISAKQANGIDSYAYKHLLGDWVYWNDTVNGQVRLVSPQAFVAGKLTALSPEQSPLNKPLYAVVGTQKSSLNQVYSGAELQALIGAGIDLITNPVPGGNYFGVRAGHNSSSNPLTNGDNYTRLTNYIASTLNAGLGKFVGELQTPSERLKAQGALMHFLGAMESQGMIGDVNGGPAYSVQLDARNNPSDRVALGYQQADIKVKYLAVVEKFIVNFEGSAATVVPSGNPTAA